LNLSLLCCGLQSPWLKIENFRIQETRDLLLFISLDEPAIQLVHNNKITSLPNPESQEFNSSAVFSWFVDVRGCDPIDGTIRR
jgi:hypothetical protein